MLGALAITASVSSGYTNTLLLLLTIHLQITQRKNLIIGQAIHRWLGRGATEPQTMYRTRAASVRCMGRGRLFGATTVVECGLECQDRNELKGNVIENARPCFGIDGRAIICYTL